MRDWAATLGTLMRDRGADLFGYAYLLTGSDQQAEDLLHQAVIRTFRAGRGFEDVDAAHSEVRRSITSAFVDHARRSPESVATSPEPVPKSAPETHGAPASGADAKLRASLLSLPPLERACVVLRYLDEVPVEDIAATTKLPEATVERYLADGVGRLSARHPDLDFTEVFTISVGDGRSR